MFRGAESVLSPTSVHLPGALGCGVDNLLTQAGSHSHAGSGLAMLGFGAVASGDGFMVSAPGFLVSW